MITLAIFVLGLLSILIASVHYFNKEKSAHSLILIPIIILSYIGFAYLFWSNQGYPHNAMFLENYVVISYIIEKDSVVAFGYEKDTEEYRLVRLNFGDDGEGKTKFVKRFEESDKEGQQMILKVSPENYIGAKNEIQYDFKTPDAMQKN